MVMIDGYSQTWEGSIAINGTWVIMHILYISHYSIQSNDYTHIRWCSQAPKPNIRHFLETLFKSRQTIVQSLKIRSRGQDDLEPEP